MEKQNPPAYGSPAMPAGQPVAQAYPQPMPQQGYPQQPQMAAQPMGAPPQMMPGQPMPSPPQMMMGQQPQYAMQGQQMHQPMHQPMGQQQQMAYQQPQMDGKMPVIVTQQPVAGNQLYQSAMPIATLAATPAPIDCPSCKNRAMTVTEHTTGDCTHLWALGFCFFTGLCCFIPYLVDSFKDVTHKCGRCGVHVATYKKSGGTQVHVFA